MEPSSTRYSWLSPILWAALAFPVAVLSHEAAHFVAYLVYGFPNPKLHTESTTYDGNSQFWKLVKAGELEKASTIVVPYQAGVASAAGIVASWIVMLLCVLLVQRKPHPFLVALGFIATFRFLGSVFVLVAGKLGRIGSDEEHVALVLPVSELALHLIGIATMLLTWYFLFRALPPLNRFRVIGLITLGAIIGGAIYLMVLGPLLLP